MKKGNRKKATECCGGEIYFNHATGDYCCSICANPVRVAILPKGGSKNE